LTSSDVRGNMLTSVGGVMTKRESELREALARRDRKRERDREYWGRHRHRINEKRRDVYSKERKLLIEAGEKGDV